MSYEKSKPDEKWNCKICTIVDVTECSGDELLTDNNPTNRDILKTWNKIFVEMEIEILVGFSFWSNNIQCIWVVSIIRNLRQILGNCLYLKYDLINFLHNINIYAQLSSKKLFFRTFKPLHINFTQSVTYSFPYNITLKLHHSTGFIHSLLNTFQILFFLYWYLKLKNNKFIYFSFTQVSIIFCQKENISNWITQKKLLCSKFLIMLQHK